MSKELTEKLENCTLGTGYYYAQLYEWDEEDDEVNDIFIGIIEVNDSVASYSGDGVDEVLAPVPTFDEYQKLKERVADADKTIEIMKKQLDIAVKALKEYADRSNWYETDDFGISAIDQFACDDYGYNIAEEALKEMEGVK